MSAALKLVIPEISALLAALLSDPSAGESLAGFQRLCCKASGAGIQRQDPYVHVAGQLGLARTADGAYPHAAYARYAIERQPDTDFWFKLSPVHYTSASSGLILQSIDSARLWQQENAQLTGLLQTLARERKISVAAGADGSWLVSAGRRSGPETVPLYQVRDRPVAQHLPSGGDAAFWARWLAECEMSLHDHAVNRERLRRGLPEVSGFWLWGGGQLPEAMPAGDSHQLLTNDATLRGMALWHGCATADFGLPEPGTRHLSVVAADFTLSTSRSESSGLVQWLTALDDKCIQPATAMLARGELASLQLTDPVAGATWRLKRTDLKKFWRMRPVFPGQT